MTALTMVRIRCLWPAFNSGYFLPHCCNFLQRFTL